MTLRTPARRRSMMTPSPVPLRAILHRKCACGGSAGMTGECEACKSKKLLGKPLQPKLQISEPGDQYEQEADRVAERVMRMPDRGSCAPLRESIHTGNGMLARTPILQRAEAGDSTPATESDAPKEEGGRCPSWRGDPQSISKRAGEFYARNHLTPPSQATVERIECEAPRSNGNYGCYVHFSDGLVLRVIVRETDIVVGMGPGPITTEHPPPATPLCWYEYSCPEGDLVLTVKKCQSSKPGGSSGPPAVAQRAAASGARGSMTAPPIVHEVLNSPGRPLDVSTRAFFEPRFGHDFAHVRVHTDAKAAESAKAVNASAYTVGRELVFGTGHYAPQTEQGKRLMAHELTHVLQQSPHGLDAIGPRPGSTAAATPLQRACLPAADCAAPRATLTEFVEETEKKPENISKADKRKKACTAVPRDPSCTADGHGATATALTTVLKANYASRLGYITGVYVHKDMPATWGAVTNDCANFMPPLPGGKCTFVPDTLEAQAKLYQGGAKAVDGRPRQSWLTTTIGILTHETEHARFDTAAPIPEPSPTACKFADHESNLSEMAAHLSEMHVFYRDALARPSKDRFKRFYGMFDYWVKNGAEDISGIVKDLRCKCECADADYFITKTVESVSASQKWDSNERFMIHTELRDSKWALKWPVAPPASVNIGDLPTNVAAPLKFE